MERKTKPSKFYVADFQEQDLAFLVERPHGASANWSEMGCFKTTTAEYLMQKVLAPIRNPRVLVITTKSGKGTYYESVPEILPHWEMYDISSTRFRIVLNGNLCPFPVELPDPLYRKPVIAVAHYHCFTNRACKVEKALDKEEMKRQGRDKKHPIFKFAEDRSPIYTNPFCAPLLLQHWDMVILDEAHRIKNPDTQWTNNIKRIKCYFRHIMTGTGFINNPLEICSLLNFLAPDDRRFTSQNRFKEQYCKIETDDNGYNKIVGIKEEEEENFRALVREFGVRRRMLEVFPDIGEPIKTKVTVELNATQRKMYDQIKRDLYTLDQNGVPLHSANVLSMLNRLRQVCVATPEVIADYFDSIAEKRVFEVKLVEPSSKLDAVMEILEGMEWDADAQDQLVIFSCFKDPLYLLEARFKKAGIPYIHMEAKHSDTERYHLWHELWPTKQHRVFMATLQLGGESINLTSARHAVFLDRSWSPKDNMQGIGRVYRPGQTGIAQIINIEAENTRDQRLEETNMTKIGWFKQIFGTDEELEEMEAEKTATDDFLKSLPKLGDIKKVDSDDPLY